MDLVTSYREFLRLRIEWSRKLATLFAWRMFHPRLPPQSIPVLEGWARVPGWWTAAWRNPLFPNEHSAACTPKYFPATHTPPVRAYSLGQFSVLDMQCTCTNVGIRMHIRIQYTYTYVCHLCSTIRSGSGVHAAAWSHNRPPCHASATNSAPHQCLHLYIFAHIFAYICICVYLCMFVHIYLYILVMLNSTKAKEMHIEDPHLRWRSLE